MVRFQLSKAGRTRLLLLPLDGSLARAMDLGDRDAGDSAVDLDLRSQASGIYFVVLEVGGQVQARFKLAVVR